MNSEKVKLYDLDNNLVDVIGVPPRMPDSPSRRLIYRGKKYIEGGAEDSFYKYGEFAEVEKDA